MSISNEPPSSYEPPFYESHEEFTEEYRQKFLKKGVSHSTEEPSPSASQVKATTTPPPSMGGVIRKTQESTQEAKKNVSSSEESSLSASQIKAQKPSPKMNPIIQKIVNFFQSFRLFSTSKKETTPPSLLIPKTAPGNVKAEGKTGQAATVQTPGAPAKPSTSPAQVAKPHQSRSAPPTEAPPALPPDIAAREAKKAAINKATHPFNEMKKFVNENPIQFHVAATVLKDILLKNGDNVTANARARGSKQIRGLPTQGKLPELSTEDRKVLSDFHTHLEGHIKKNTAFVKKTEQMLGDKFNMAELKELFRSKEFKEYVASVKEMISHGNACVAVIEKNKELLRGLWEGDKNMVGASATSIYNKNINYASVITELASNPINRFLKLPLLMGVMADCFKGASDKEMEGIQEEMEEKRDYFADLGVICNSNQVISKLEEELKENIKGMKGSAAVQRNVESTKEAASVVADLQIKLKGAEERVETYEKLDDQKKKIEDLEKKGTSPDLTKAKEDLQNMQINYWKKRITDMKQIQKNWNNNTKNLNIEKIALEQEIAKLSASKDSKTIQEKNNQSKILKNKLYVANEQLTLAEKNLTLANDRFDNFKKIHGIVEKK